MGQLGSQYVTGPAWACAARPPRQSAANTNARPNLPAKIDIRATAKCPEIIRSRYQERQRGAVSPNFAPIHLNPSQNDDCTKPSMQSACLKGATKRLMHRSIACLFDQLVGMQQERFRYRGAERLGGLEIDD